jgi:hypothetical protein
MIPALIIAAVSCDIFSTKGVKVDICVDRPPGVVNFVYPQYPAKLATYNWSGKGVFLLKVNPKTWCRR